MAVIQACSRCLAGLVLAVLLLPTQSNAQEPLDLPPPGKTISFTSEILGEERELWIYLPASYSRNPGSYPVLYLLDGSYHFRHVTASVDFLADRALAPEMIVVGIVSDDRNRTLDYTPSTIEQIEGSGGADAFLRFLRDELIPYIETEYRAASMRILAGHSYGGLLTTYALVAESDLFNAYIAVSPSLHWDERMIFPLAQRRLKASWPQITFLFFTMGSMEREAMTSSTDDFARLLSAGSPPSLRWKYTLRDGANHDSIQLLGFYEGLSTLFDSWRVPWREDGSNWNLAAVRKHYDALSRTLGYDIPLPEYSLNALGFRKFGLEEPDSAIAAFQLNVELHPYSSDAHYYLAKAHERVGNQAEAREQLSIACELGERFQDPRLERYRSALEQLVASSR